MSNRGITGRLCSPEARERFHKRARLIRHIRQYLDERGFIEIDTPVLYPYPEIAPLEQFRTIDPVSTDTLYLRVCPTEHLKRLMVAGFEKVYEFSRNFRPSNLSYKHSCEFTSLECSELGADYHAMMNLTEAIVYGGLIEVKGDAYVRIIDNLYNLEPPWQRATVQEAILDILGVDVLNIESVEELRKQIGEIDLARFTTIDEAVDHLIEATVLPKLTRPTFLTEYPYHLGAPAQPLPEDPRVKQRCEAFIGTFEIANMSTHLNDLTKLRKWHDDTLDIKREFAIGDPVMDEPLFDALSIGFPHSAVVGIGIDRLTMLVTESSNIRDVILFPFELMVDSP